MYALVDCNNFYVSCERLFRPELRGLPILQSPWWSAQRMPIDLFAPQIATDVQHPIFQMMQADMYAPKRAVRPRMAAWSVRSQQGDNRSPCCVGSNLVSYSTHTAF